MVVVTPILMRHDAVAPKAPLYTAHRCCHILGSLEEVVVELVVVVLTVVVVDADDADDRADTPGGANAGEGITSSLFGPLLLLARPAGRSD